MAPALDLYSNSLGHGQATGIFLLKVKISHEIANQELVKGQTWTWSMGHKLDAPVVSMMK